MKSKFALTFDNILISFTVFTLFYLWLRRIIKIKFICTLIGIVVSVLIFFIFEKIALNKYNHLNLSKKEEKTYNEILNIIKTYSDSKISIFIEKLFSTNRISNNIFEGKNCYFYINLKSKLSSFDFVYSLNFYLEAKKNLPIIFLSIGHTNEFNELLKDSIINYKLFYYDDLYEIMKRKNLYPENTFKQITLQKQNKLILLKQNLRRAISKAKFKEFFFSGISLVAISIFIPFSFYYLISGTIFLIISILCLILKNTDQNLKSDTKLKDYCE